MFIFTIKTLKINTKLKKKKKGAAKHRTRDEGTRVRSAGFLEPGRGWASPWE